MVGEIRDRENGWKTVCVRRWTGSLGIQLRAFTNSAIETIPR